MNGYNLYGQLVGQAFIDGMLHSAVLVASCCAGAAIAGLFVPRLLRHGARLLYRSKH